MMASSSQTGRCFCGRIKYELTGPAATPVRKVVCHCLNCRRITGCAFNIASICPKDGFRVTEGDRYQKTVIDDRTDSGTDLQRVFCSECGTNLFAKTPLFENIISVAAGTLDDFDSWRPDTEQYCIHRAHFLEKAKTVEEERAFERAVPGRIE